jgi:hypothetical protein
MPAPQTYKNHARIVPIYHIGVFFPLAANLLWAAYRLTGGITGDSVISLLVAIALLLMFFSVRVQILTVQDRVIRAEMRARLREVLPADLAARCGALTIPQLIALRFASDAELPALVRDVLAGSLTTQKDIKLRVKNWQADYQRA